MDKWRVAQGPIDQILGTIQITNVSNSEIFRDSLFSIAIPVDSQELMIIVLEYFKKHTNIF